MNKEVLVLGAGGMAGHVVSIFLREKGFSVDTLSASRRLDDQTFLIDVTDKTSLESILSKKHYDVVINCIGLLVKQSEERKDLATYINAYLPHYLEKYFENTKTKLIHLSTDCVFSGRHAPYREKSSYDGKSFYDRSKALGEIINDKDLTLRMSIIGPDANESGIGLFNWFYKQTGEIGGYTKAIWSGITTIELAKGIVEAIRQNLTGLYHLVPDNSISKFDLLQLFKDVFHRDDITITPNAEVSLDKTLVNTRNDFNFQVSDYETMAREMKVWIEAHSDRYDHYNSEENRK